MNKVSNIPTGWIEVRIGNLCKSLVPGRNKPKIFDGDIPWVNTPDINSRYIPLSNHAICITKEEVKNCGGKIVPAGAVVMACVGDLGLVAITIKDIVINQQLHAFVCPENIYNEYIAYSLKAQKSQMYKLASLTTIPYLNKSNCESLEILLPPLQEQKAIAGILEKWDEAIEKTSKLIEAKKKRFEWVRKFSLTTKKDWENIKLKDFLIESNQKSQIENEYKILSSTMNSVEIRSGRVDAVSNIGYKIIRRNQLVLSPQNLWLGNINVNTDYEVGLVSPSYKIFDFNENIILSDFAKFLFKTNKMLWNYKLCSEAGASVVRRNLDLNLFYEIKIFIPALEQQKQIAKTLNTAKKEITILEEILGKYKSQKKGLMQKLLTGKSRVNNINFEN